MSIIMLRRRSEFILFNPAGMLAAGEVRIAVVLAAKIVLQHIVGELPDQVAADLGPRGSRRSSSARFCG